MLRSAPITTAVLALMALAWPGVSRAAETCTIMYTLDAQLTVSDTDFGKGDVSIPVKGMMLLEFDADEQEPTDGDVGILHFAIFQKFTVDTVVTVTTAVHDFAPTCSGEREPTWRKPTDPGFPKMCGYTGNQRPVATGTLRRNDTVIEWDKCKAAPTYWSENRKAYAPGSKSRGKGCLNEMRAVGNVHCDGRFACKLGSLSRGDNPIDISWDQPLIAGPPDTPGRVYISRDLSRLESPKPAKGGQGSYNLLNDSPSRVWLSFKGTRDDASRHTTCR